MKNRAKCKLCQSIIESFHATDYVSCKCGEISVDGGDALKCAAKNWNNFVRVDDEGNEILVKVDNVKPLDISKPSRKDLLDMLDEMVKSYERLPQNAMLSPVTNADLAAALLLVAALFRAVELE